MLPFATEFPVISQNRASFMAQVLSWLRGSNYSKVLDNPRDRELEGDTSYIRAENGEELRFREFNNNGQMEAIGFRHDNPDRDGRLWRTEGVLRRGAAGEGQDLIRFRTQCIARLPGARLETPRKLYLIKSILRDGWGGVDSPFAVSDQPLWLANTAADLKIARAATLGQTKQYLPVIYVSASGTSKWLFSKDQIEKLAFDLGGVAHVVVEPNRTFSFELRELTSAANAYGGTIAIMLPGRGVVRRFYVGWRLPEVGELQEAVREVAIRMRSLMPAQGWDWTELQEQALRLQRTRDRNRLSVQETEGLYQEEIQSLQERVKQLEEQLAARPLEEVSDLEDETFLPSALVKKIGPEIYPGEFSDRLRGALKYCVERAEQLGVHSRSRFVLDAIVKNLPVSPELGELLDDLKRVTKDSKRLASEVTRLLDRHGYKEKSDNKHIKLEARKGYVGLGPITLAKTPSDSRGLTNARKQIESTLGIAKLAE